MNILDVENEVIEGCIESHISRITCLDYNDLVISGSSDSNINIHDFRCNGGVVG